MIGSSLFLPTALILPFVFLNRETTVSSHDAKRISQPSCTDGFKGHRQQSQFEQLQLRLTQTH